MTDELDLRALCKLIFRRKKTIIGSVAGCIILAGAVSLLMPRAYEASLLLELGDINLSPQIWKQGMKMIEGAVETASVMRSTGTLEEVRRRLNLEISPSAMRRRLEIITYFEANAYLPILKVSYEGKTPREATDILTALVGIIIERHTERSRPYREWIEDRIKYIREKITATEKIIAAQSQYRDLFQKYIERGEVSAEEFSRELGELGSSRPSAVDMLYLQGSALTEKQLVADATRFKADLDMKIAQNENEIAAAEIEIVDLRGMKDLSTPTAVISPAVVPDKPSKPKRVLMMAVAGLLGLAGSILYVFFREYLKG